jgi:hypothetical protein
MYIVVFTQHSRFNKIHVLGLLDEPVLFRHIFFSAKQMFFGTFRAFGTEQVVPTRCITSNKDTLHCLLVPLTNTFTHHMSRGATAKDPNFVKHHLIRCLLLVFWAKSPIEDVSTVSLGCLVKLATTHVSRLKFISSCSQTHRQYSALLRFPSIHSTVEFI